MNYLYNQGNSGQNSGLVAGENSTKATNLNGQNESNNPLSTAVNLMDDPKTSIPNKDSLDIKKKDGINLSADSTKKLSDSSKVDTTLRAKYVFLDSTARMEQFHYHREDKTYTEFSPHKRSKFFVYPSSSLATRTVALDSTGNFVVISEKIAGQETKVLLRIPIDEYVKLRLKNNTRDLWEKKAYEYELKSGKKDLGQLLTDITNIDIPLPSVGFLSIFGPPVINLRIGGAVDIHGAWRSETTEGVTASLLGNTRNEPDFKQQVQINVNGTIGDKLTISADWNTERTFEYENQLKIKYKGYPDEIVQSVEAGNVALQTSSLVGGSDALFGVKAQFQLGPLTLMALASQKKGEVKEVSVSGGSTSSNFSFHAYDYSKNHFFLDTIYADTTSKNNMFFNYYANATPIVDDRYRVKEIEVWKTASGVVDKNKERHANAFIDLPSRKKYEKYDDAKYRGSIESYKGKTESGRFIRLSEGSDYEIHRETGYITFKTQIQDNDAIAVAYKTESIAATNDDDDYYGELISEEATADTSKNIILKLVKPQNLSPEMKQAWKLMLKNIYPIGARSVSEEGFELDIQYAASGTDPVNQINGKTLLNAFGLDKYSEGGMEQKDGKFDFKTGKTIFTETGEIIFPTLQPFGRNFPGNLPDTLRYNDVYDTTVTAAKNQGGKDKFIITGKSSAGSKSTFSLGLTGIVENSVKVKLGGMELKEGTDYIVDYNIGQVTIKNDAALVPGADLKITYEQNDLFQLASKTLIGLRGEFNISPKTVLGFSALNLNQQTLSDKVRIGEEPLSNSIYGLDFKTAVDLPFINKGLNSIIPSKTMSSLSFQGEFAYINPDPNTKKSTISGDNNKSIAYIDDFEGTKKTIPVGLSYTSWHDLSVPNVHGKIPYTEISELSKSEQMDYKGKSWWYNVMPSDVHVKDIWGQRKKVAKNDDYVTTLDMVFDPGRRGTYNRTPKLNDPTKMWGGMMKQLSSTANNLVDENIEFIEFWINLKDVDQNLNDSTKLYIDLGKISEDVIPNGILNSEDKNGNQLIDNGEDTGIDGLTDEQERQVYGSTEADPNGDDYSFTSGSNDYSSINGTEGNAVSIDAGKFPDTEDKSNNLSLDQLDSYFRYAIPLDSNRTTNHLITSGENAARWYQFRIPLKDFVAEIGDPTLSNVDCIRLWVTGIKKPVHIRLAEFNLTGNQWQKVLPKNQSEDSTLSLSVANYEDNYPTYYLPPGVTQERDRSNTEENVFRNEQSLSLVMNQLQDGDERQVIKYVREIDLFNYKEMKFYVHGDERAGYNIALHTHDASHQKEENKNVNKDSIAAELYFRFGTDTSNYYEYRMPVENAWMNLDIKFEELTTLKQTRDSSKAGIGQKEIAGLPGHYYAIKGNPTLTKVTLFMFGIRNPKGRGIVTPLSGDVWVNELRVIGAEDKSGWAYSTSGKIVVGDLFSVNFNANRTDPYFHKISDRFGSRSDSRSWGVNVDFDVLKVFPVNLPGSNLRVVYARTEQIATPLYQPGTDIKIDNAVAALREKGISEDSIDAFKESTRTINTSETWTLSGIKIKIPSNYWLINYFVNNLQWGFTYNKTFGRTPTVALNKTWSWNANMSYQLNFSQNNFFYPADIPLLGKIVDLFDDYRNVKFYYSPQSFTWNLTATRNYTFNLSRGRNIDPSISRSFKSTRGATTQWKFTDGGFFNFGINYGFDFSSSLDYLLVDENKIERSESQIWKDIFSKAFFGKDIDFRQNVEFRSTPKLPSIWNINKYFTLNWGYSSSYSWRNDLAQEEFGRSAGFGSKANASVQLKLKSLMAPLFKDLEIKESKSSKPMDTRAKERSNGQPAPGGQPGPSEQPRSESRTRTGRSERRLDEGVVEKADSLSKPNLKIKADSLVKGKSQIPDSSKTKKVSADSLEKGSGISKLSIAWRAIQMGIKWIFFDYESIQMSFSNENSVQKSGLKGVGSGIANFWGLFQKGDNGPLRNFMLGFSSDVGPRAFSKLRPGNLSDNYSQRNTIDFKTSRPLWEGASIELRWKVNWQISKSATILRDTMGNATISNPTSTGSIARSFFSLPPISLLKFIKSGIKHVNELYDPEKNNLSEAFLDGFESVPFASKLAFLKDFAKYIPRPNWSITWDGIEKYSLFKSWTKRVQLSHAYNSDYTEGWKIESDGSRTTQSQIVSYGFSPLLGINLTFNSLWNGDLTASIKYNTKTGYNLGVTTKNITESFSKDIGVSASYSKKGFEFPFFGISLKNDIEVSFAYTTTTNTTVVYELGDNFTEKGTPTDGTVRTSIEPRIKYTISSKVTLSIFYKRSSTAPQGASRITPITTNEAGLDVHIAIQ